VHHSRRPADLDVTASSAYASGMSEPARKQDDDLEPLTAEQRAAVDAWKAGGMKDSPEVAALRKKIRGEVLTNEEQALLATATRKPSGPTVPHVEVMRMLEERKRLGE
jgi:hypothetical protein